MNKKETFKSENNNEVLEYINLVITDNEQMFEKFKTSLLTLIESFDHLIVMTVEKLGELIEHFPYLFNNVLVVGFEQKIKLNISNKVFDCFDCRLSAQRLEQFKQVDFYRLREKVLLGKRYCENYLMEYYNCLENHTIEPSLKKLAIVQVGDNFASSVYVKNKIKLANRLCIGVEKFQLEAQVSQKELNNLITKLNHQEDIGGIIIQLPLAKHLNQFESLNKVAIEKDVDCFSANNLGLVFQNYVKDDLYPATPKGIIHLLKWYEIPLKSKNVVIVGRSNIVGKPLAHMFLKEDATVTICHSKTKNLKSITKKADILVSAIGMANFFDESYIKKGCICVDVGMNRDENNKLCGDFDYENVYEKADYITPVPFGIGQMTLIMLFDNFINLNLKIKSKLTNPDKSIIDQMN